MLRALDREPSPAGSAGIAALLGLEDREGGRRLVCRACAHGITTERERMEISGAHEHEKQNPAGFVFRIGCFRAAPGCVEAGPEVAEHTWFAGYTWQIALCGGCFIHLGWAFSFRASGAQPGLGRPGTLRELRVPGRPSPGRAWNALFRAGRDRFHGLVLDRLRVEEDGPPPA